MTDISEAGTSESKLAAFLRRLGGRGGGIVAAGLLGWAGLVGAAAAEPGPEPAWREEILSPHWEWGGHHAGGTVRALCLTNGEAAFDPEELALREDMDITTLGVGGQQTERTIDQKRFQAELDIPRDVVIFATESGWNALSEESRAKLFRKVAEGLSVIVRPPPREQAKSGFKELRARPSLMDKQEALNGAAGGLPVGTLPFRQPLAIQCIAEGAGRIILIDGYTSTTHWTWTNAFTPNMAPPSMLPYDEDRTRMELYYAFAARTARWAAKKQGPVTLGAALPPETAPAVGAETRLRVPWTGDAKEGDRLRWSLYSPQGEFLASGEAPRKQPLETELAVTPPQSGRLLLRWRAVREGKTLDYGAAFLDVKTPASLAGVSAPEKIAPEAPVEIRWRIDGAGEPADRVIAQLYDPDGGLMAVGEAASSAGKLVTTGWTPHFVSHRLRLLLTRGGTILDEKRLPVQVALDRGEDRKAYQTIVWSSEQGILTERKRFRLLRDLGITALANIGRSETIARRASEEGLRLVPTNVLVPKPAFDREAQGKGIRAYAETAAKYTPLGYSLADEPSGTTDAVEFRNWGAEIIRQADPDVPVGYCGVWEGFDKNVPRFFENCDFVEAYSPFHLYDLNIWSGNERDLYRSFRQPNGLLTCWTHYAPWADHEPYSRTVPWLWLFEEMNGVSYFSSGGEFAILPPDLRSTHESRWWSSEVAEIQRGIGEQIIAMRRDHGAVRLLFTPNADGSALWARALNEKHIPYCFVSHKELAAGLGGEVRLLVCPNLLEVSSREIEQMTEIARRGGVVVATAPLGAVGAVGAVDGDGSASAQALFGFRREEAPVAAADEWKKQASPRNNILVKTDWTPEGSAAALSGRSLGEAHIKPAGADRLASFRQVGDKTADAEEKPNFVQDLFALPAALRKTAGKGTAFYLTFQPDLASLKSLLPALLAQAGIHPAPARVEMADKRDDTVYLFPFQKDAVRLVGVVPDYIRRLPVSKVEGGEETRLYYHHGPYLWKEDAAELVLDAPAHLYDVRRGLYLGFAARAPFKVKGGRPELFACLPYKIERLSLVSADHATAGEPLKVEVRLQADKGVPGLHVVHLALTDPQGRQTVSEQRNVHTAGGRGSAKFSLPFNAPPGAWKIVARDAVTGVAAESSLQVAPPSAPPGPLLQAEEVSVKKVALDWPEGTLTPYVEKPPKTAVSIGAPRIVPMRLKGHEKHKSVFATFNLTNPQITYGVRYSACNDTEAHQESDPRRAWGQYLPGIGFNLPNANSWYYNNYIHIALDDLSVGNYILSDLKEVKAGDDGKVVVTWDTPKGKVDLAFVLMHDHTGIFQELKIYDVTEPIQQVTVKFSGYYWGLKPGDKQSDGFVTVDPSGENAWALMGNKVNEPAYGKGSGACAIRVLPEEFDEVKYGYPTTMEKTVDIRPGQTASLRWVLWTFSSLSNAKALEYMNSDSASGVSRERLLKLFNPAH